MKFIFFTHKEYSHLWSIMINFIKINHIENVLIAINEYDEYFKDYNVIVYPKDSYSNKVKFILSQIEDEYIFWNHDIYLLVEINLLLIDKIKNAMKINNIKRICLFGYNPFTLFNNDISNNDIIKIDETVDIVKNYNFFLYSVGPSIWEKNVLLDIMTKFPDRSYREIENEDVQIYVSNNYIIYQIYSNRDDDIYHLNNFFNKNFKICQIFNGFYTGNSRIYKDKNNIYTNKIYTQSYFCETINNYLEKNKIDFTSQIKSFNRD